MKIFLRLVLPIFILIFLTGSCEDENQINDFDVNPNLIGIDGGTITNDNGASITIPPGALSKATEITIQPYDHQSNSNEFTPALGDIVGGVVLGPDGLSFQEPITITIPLNKSFGPDVSEVKIFYKNNGDPSNSNYPPDYSGWQQTDFIGIVNADRQSVTAQIDHFSVYTVQMGFGEDTLDIIGDMVETMGDNGLSVDFANFQEYFESTVANLGDVNEYILGEPANYGEYEVVGLEYTLHHNLETLFEPVLNNFKGMPGDIEFWYNYHGDRIINEQQFAYHLTISVYMFKVPDLDVIEIDVPTVTTSFLTDDEDKVAYAGGEVTDAGAITEGWIEFVTERGIYLNGDKIILMSSVVDEGIGIGSFLTELDLIPNNTYYVRAYATNSAGEGYGEKIGFVLDIDGNIYRIVIIGEQEWIAKNLKTTRLNDGTSIPLLANKFDWDAASAIGTETPAYSWYNNDINNKLIYGALYNWYTVDTGKLCPKGWHVPSKEEYIALAEFAGGEDIAGGKLKEKGTTHWQSPNTGATNEFGLTALPGGIRTRVTVTFDFEFAHIGRLGYWWTRSNYKVRGADGYGYVNMVSLHSNDEIAHLSAMWGGHGMSVLCVKD